MQFHVAGETYNARITSGPIRLNGAPTLVAPVEMTRELLISADAAPQDRWRLLLAGLSEAWIIHTGQPSGRTGWCDLFATMSKAAMRDLALAGGEAALMAMVPGEGTHSTAMRITMTKDRCCGKCNGTVAAGSVIAIPANIVGQVDMAIYCPHCDHVQRWREFSSFGGLPSNIAACKATFERGEAVGRFLAEHPHAAMDLRLVGD